ncbi:Two pore potassium channel b [Dichanthelium oligosanthes]|uniref:Two pore potassium channel b n=1 Tax=Dichanthelium oligosanthes TaxID=888268 RepID=A0A1E5UY63_9POAL|nr:Two pore potassium channel b [Dichanthelium oligosanthes]
MAKNGVQQHLLHDHDPSNVPAKIPPPGRARRFRRCQTAPSHKGSTLQSRQDDSAASPLVPPKGLLTGARPRFWLICILLLAYLLAGTAAFYLVMDHMSGDRSASRALDALYFCVVTMTTVGYGDLVPSSDAAKLLACAFAFAGVALVGTFLSKAADYLVEKQEALVFRTIHLHHADDCKTLRDMEANKVLYKLYTAAALLTITLASGMAFLVKVEGMRPVDAFYCVCVTVTTLGYGDRSFSSAAGRAFAAAWITVSTLVVALFFLYAAELGAERRQKALAQWVLTRRTTSMDLEAADLNGDHRVSAAEFALYKLKELGKISKEEISEFLEEFDILDVDQSGTLSCHDLAVAQPS